MVLCISKSGDSTTALDYLFQCLTNLNFKLKKPLKIIKMFEYFFSSEVLGLYVYSINPNTGEIENYI